MFSKALPCLSAIGCALSPDYSYTQYSNEQQQFDYSDHAHNEYLKLKSKIYDPQTIDINTISLTNEFEEIIKAYSEHVHDFWCYNKVNIIYLNVRTSSYKIDHWSI